jgi:hypothetical protein
MVRWALGYLFNSDLLTDDEQLVQIKHRDRFVYGPLAVALQHVYIYYRVDGTPYVNKCPILATQLGIFLDKLVKQAENKGEACS